MSTDATLTPNQMASPPTSVRHLVLAVATLMSVLLYLDRFAVGIAAEYIREDLRMTQTQMAWFVSAFFWAYALCQVPAGWLSDRFGARSMLTIYILGWSVFTGLMGVTHVVWLLLWLRVFCGATQAGAYPTAAGLIRQWYPISFRGTASSMVGLGGRFGAVLAPLLTAWMIVEFVSGKPAPVLSQSDILDGTSFMAHFDAEHAVASTKDLDLKRQRFVGDFIATLPQEQRDELMSKAHLAAEKVKQRKIENGNAPKAGFDFRDWIPQKAKSVEQRPDGLDEVVEALSKRMPQSELVDFASIPLKLPQSGKALLDRRNAGDRLTDDETIRLNRTALETLFRAEIRKSQGPGWRPTVIVYGVAGMVVALMFWIVTSNTPHQHSWCNDAERSLIGKDVSQKSTSIEPQKTSFPWRAFLTSLSLWGNSLTQFLTNFGWFFVVSSLPRYLEEVHGVPLVMQGVMTAFPSGTGIFGLFLGGRCTDWACRRYGLKWGRRVPLSISRFTAAGGYGLCLVLGILVEPGSDKTWLPWLFVLGLCIAAGSTDFGTPAIWAYAQDVGGRFTASILGWSNMWGNLGAAVAPLIYNACLGETPSIQNWNSVFAVCCGAFVIAGLFALLLDATKNLTIE